MDNLPSNDVSRRKALQFSLGNVRYRDENGSSGNTEHGEERVTKSRSHDWYSVSPSRRGRNGSLHSGESIFPKSVTANILSPKVSKHQLVYESRTHRSDVLSSGRWPPNSIEDRERETTRSSSNPEISSSISEEDFGENKKPTDLSSPLKTQLPCSDLQETGCPATTSLSSENLEGRLLHHSDSLPHHRERLSQKRKRLVWVKREFPPFPPFHYASNKEGGEVDCASSSSSISTYCKRTLRKIPSEKTTESLPRLTASCEIHDKSAKRPKNLTLSQQERHFSLADVGSWLANQSFDYIDSSYSAYNTIAGQNSPCPVHHSNQAFVRRQDEIFFGMPTPRDVTFNVSGQHYRVDPELLARFPDTLLGSLEKRAKYWDSRKKEYFLDRHKATFEVVIEYYKKNGTLTRPDDIPIDIFIHEIKFYCLDRENLVSFLSAEGILLVVKEKPMPDTPAKRFIWNLFEDPESCTIARIVTTVSAIVIALSVIVFCMETLPDFHSLGEGSLDNIQPALNNCEWYLRHETQFFQPVGDLFAMGDTDSRTNRLPENREVNLGSNRQTIGGHHRKHGIRSHRSVDRHTSTNLPPLNIQTIASGLAQGEIFDEFDGTVVLSTMQRTLTICAAEETMSLLSKYTYLRCEAELTEWFKANLSKIFEILREIEVHNHGHDNEKAKEGHNDGQEGASGVGEVGNLKAHQKYNKTEITSRRIGTAWLNVTDIHDNLDKKNNARRKRRKCRKQSKAGGAKINNINQQGRNSTSSSRRKSKTSRHFQRTEDSHKTNANSTIKKAANAKPRHKRVHRSKLSRDAAVSDDAIQKSMTQNATSLMTLKQTIRGLTQLCVTLDNDSIRSSYSWFVLEARLGGPAGQLFLIESGCIVWFVIEIFLRFFSCPDKLKFCTNFLNIIDAIAIMPYFITLIVTSLHTSSNLRPQTATILRTIRLVRMLRILKLSRHSRGLRILGLTLVRSTRVLVLLVCFQMVLAVTFSSIVYYVEYDAKDTQFKSIPGSFWWAIITMTTVGYGDVVPITTPGKITGSFCAIMGILGIAFPVPVIVSNFNYLYNLDSDACKLTPEELMEDPEESDNDRNNNVDKFQENLLDAVRRNVGSMTSGPQEGQPTGQNPAELWNYTRRQYHSSDKKRQTKQQELPKHK